MMSEVRTCIAALWQSPQRHSREGGDLFSRLEQAVRPIPASAAATLRSLAASIAALAIALSGQALAAPPQEGPEAAVELVDPKVFRVCSDASNMPFSNARGEGFENKIAELVAAKLGKPVSYTWYPNSLGFVRNTLGAYKCDVIMGMPQGDDIAQVTNPYYAAAYALVFKPDSGLEGVNSLSDPRLKGKRLGIVAGTPPSTAMAANGLMALAKPYPLVVDTRVDLSPQAMNRDIEAGAIDAWRSVGAARRLLRGTRQF